MSAVSTYIIAGLSFRNPESSASEGITVDLANRLRKLGGRVMVASHHEWREVLEDILKRPQTEDIVPIGHSLGGSILPTLARLAGREIAAIIGFDPASNPAANLSEYRLTKVPANVKLAKAIYIPGGGLGGGMYEAESPNTIVKNIPVNHSHLTLDNDIEPHLAIADLHERLLAA
jgi:hypothetical protein